MIENFIVEFRQNKPIVCVTSISYGYFSVHCRPRGFCRIVIDLGLTWVYDFTAKTFGTEVKTGQNVNREKAYLVESQFKIKLKL